MKKEFDKAIADANDAIRLDPSSAVAFETRGSAWQNDIERSIADYSEAIRLKSTSPKPYLFRAGYWNLKKEFDKAIADANEAIRLDPKSAFGHYVRGMGWQGKKQYDDAISDYNTAIQLGVWGGKVYADRALCWDSKQNFGKAIADNEEALRIDPKEPAVLHNLALLLASAPDAKLRDAKRAIELAKLALAMDKNNSQYMECLATAYAEAHDYDEAVRWQERAMENPEVKRDPQARLRLERYRRKEPLHR